MYTLIQKYFKQASSDGLMLTERKLNVKSFSFYSLFYLAAETWKIKMGLNFEIWNFIFSVQADLDRPTSSINSKLNFFFLSIKYMSNKMWFNAPLYLFIMNDYQCILGFENSYIPEKGLHINRARKLYRDW